MNNLGRLTRRVWRWPMIAEILCLAPHLCSSNAWWSRTSRRLRDMKMTRLPGGDRLLTSLAMVSHHMSMNRWQKEKDELA